MLISYSQNFEDVILWRALKHVVNGFYIDIGAQDPVCDSVSLAFYEKGWRGLHVEPVPSNATRLREARPDEEVIEAAIARNEGEIEIFEIAETGLSTGKDAIAKKHKAGGFKTKSIKVATLPLSKLLERHAGRDIHWLKIDVEGMEAEVIASWQESPTRPWVLCIESTLPNTQQQNFADWEPDVLGRGYIHVYFDGLNRFYVHQDHADLSQAFGVGPNYFDDFSVGGTSPFSRRLAGEVAALTQNLAASNDGLQQQSAEVARLHNHIAATDKAYAEERGGLNDRVAQLARLSQEKDAEISRLHHHIASTDKAYAEERGGLNERLAHLTRLEDEKDAEIGRLHHRIASTDKAYAEERGGLNERLAHLTRLEDEKDAEIGRLHDHVAKTDSAYAEERGGLNERVVHLTRLGEEKDAEISRLHDHIASTDKAYAEERGGLNERVVHLTRLGEEKDAEISRLHDHIDETRRANTGEQSGLSERVAQLAKSGEEKDAEIGRLQDHIAAIRKSTSWRVTAPMRGLVGGSRAVARTPKESAVLVMHHGLLWVRRRPRAVELVRRLVRFAPPLERRLLAFARARSGFVIIETGWTLQPDPVALRAWRKRLKTAKPT